MDDRLTVLGYIAVLTSALSSCIVLSAVLIGVRRAAQVRWLSPISEGRRRPAGLWITSEFEDVMQSALALNSYEVGRGELQGIRLSESIRYSPDDYEAAIREISDAYRRNRVIAVDVRKMDQRSAIRLMDFCSGLSAGSMGWIFRLSDNVLVLTPGVQ